MAVLLNVFPISSFAETINFTFLVHFKWQKANKT